MTFDQAINQIKKTYLELGHQKGYRFLLSPKSTFSSEILFLNLNPGGDRIPPDHPWDSCENGPAHLTESWGNNLPVGKAPLQVQVQRLFSELSKYVPGNRDLIHESLIAYFIPFRSQRVNKLHAKVESIEFSLKLWSDIISSLKPKLIICLGEDVYKNIKTLYPGDPVIYNTKIGWGEITADVYIFKNGCRILRLPHLSTFRIFSRNECKPYIDNLLKHAADGW